MISFPCPHCSRIVKAPNKAVGKRATCPKCKNRIEIPADTKIDSPEGEANVSPTETPPPPPAAETQNPDQPSPERPRKPTDRQSSGMKLQDIIAVVVGLGFVGLIALCCGGVFNSDDGESVNVDPGVQVPNDEYDPVNLDPPVNLFADVHLPLYEVIQEEAFESLGNAVFKQDLWVKGEINAKNLRALLWQRLISIMERNNFKYKRHVHPTSVVIYVYPTKERARVGHGQWVAMLNTQRDGEPDIRIREDFLARLEQPAVSKFGLSKEMRKRIFKEIISAERRAMDEATKREPRDFKAQSALDYELGNRYKDELADKYGLTRDQLQEIGIEGVKSHWIMPPIK